MRDKGTTNKVVRCRICRRPTRRADRVCDRHRKQHGLRTYVSERGEVMGKRRGTPGTRVFDGRHFILAGRGTKAHCQALAYQLRWRDRFLVRVVPWNPFDPKALREALDDYAVYTFPREGN